MNTKICYMYRDAANYKIHCEEVIAGEIDEAKKEEFFENYSMDEFYPSQIGFKAPTFVTEGYKPYPDDPEWHEVVDFLPTDEKTTVDMTITEFMEAIRNGTATERRENK